MKISKESVAFNKEILFGEFGALVGTQVFGHYSSKFFSNPNTISIFVVIGAGVCAALFWLFARLYDRLVKTHTPVKNVTNEISYYVPASIFLTVGFYYPALFFSTRHLLYHHKLVSYSAIISQSFAFLLFLIGINSYRYLLKKMKGITL